MDWADAEAQVARANQTAKTWNLPPVFVPLTNDEGRVVGWKVDPRYQIVLDGNPQLRKRFMGE